MFPANYFFHFSRKFDYSFADRRYNQIKQIVRFTDTGYLASFLAVQSPAYVPLAFNIHFAITFGYWIAKLIMGLDDVDRTNGELYSIGYERFWGALIHGVPLVILLQKILTVQEEGDQCAYYFSRSTLVCSYIWLWTWGIVIYFPWRIRTGDAVYSFMDWRSPHWHKVGGIAMVHGLLAVANEIGGGVVAAAKQR